MQFAERGQRVLIDALTSEVDDLRARRVMHRVAFLFQHEVVGEVGDEEPEAFIKHAGILPGGAPDDVGGCTDAIDRLRCRVVEAGGIVTVREPAPRKKFVPVEGLQHHGAGSGKMADAVLHSAVRIQQLGTAGGHLQILVHVTD